MYVLPRINPVAFSLGFVEVHWYGIMYIVAFALFMLLGRIHAKRLANTTWSGQKIDDLLFIGVFGVILGGRLGEILFYQPTYYFAHPQEIIAVWHGGMSFHGGLIGVLIAVGYYAYRHSLKFFDVTDFIAPLVPLGLAAGRIGNFINGELWGRPVTTDIPWAVIYPWVDNLPRHPSQLYEALGEGVLLFIIMWLYSAKPRQRSKVSAIFLLGYGLIRFILEFFRNSDSGILGIEKLGLNTAQGLCFPMILLGLILYFKAKTFSKT